MFKNKEILIYHMNLLHGILVIFLMKNDLKQGDALSPLLLNFSLEYTIRKVRVKQEGWKLNGTHQLLVYADDVNIQ